MPAKRYKVDLSQVERVTLDELTRKGTLSARKMKRAQILIKASEGWTDERIAEALDTARTTVERTRQRVVECGLDGALSEDARPGQKRRLDGRAEAHLFRGVGQSTMFAMPDQKPCAPYRSLSGGRCSHISVNFERSN